MEYNHYSPDYSSNTPFTEMYHNNNSQESQDALHELDGNDNNIQMNYTQNDVNNNTPKHINNSEDKTYQNNNYSDGSDTDISDGRMCRYCFCEVTEDDNYSTCQCHTALCRECLERELCLTEGRQDHTMKCTVCQTQYQIDYLNDTAPSCFKIILFSIKETFCCFHLQIQGNRIASIRERIALGLLMCFLALWTSATTYSVIDPGVDKFDGFSAELLVYLFLVFMDWCVGVSMIWFVKLVETLQLSLPFALMFIHINRCLAVIIIRFMILGIDDGWKFTGNIGMVTTSLCVISACSRLMVMTALIGYRRIQMRNVQIMVGGKGPFRLRDIDRHQRQRRRRQQQQQQQQQQNNNDNNDNNSRSDIDGNNIDMAPQPDQLPVDIAIDNNNNQHSEMINIEELQSLQN